MFTNKWVLGIVALLAIAIVGTAVYATIKHQTPSAALSAIMPEGALTLVSSTTDDHLPSSEDAAATTQRETILDVNDASNSKSWFETQTVTMTADANGKVSLNVEYNHNGDEIKRTFQGTRQQVLQAIDEDNDLPDVLKTGLKGNIDRQDHTVDDVVAGIQTRIDNELNSLNELFVDDWRSEDWFANHSISDRWIDFDPWFDRQDIFGDDDPFQTWREDDWMDLDSSVDDK